MDNIKDNKSKDDIKLKDENINKNDKIITDIYYNNNLDSKKNKKDNIEKTKTDIEHYNNIINDLINKDKIIKEEKEDPNDNKKDNDINHNISGLFDKSKEYILAWKYFILLFNYLQSCDSFLEIIQNQVNVLMILSLRIIIEYPVVSDFFKEYIQKSKKSVFSLKKIKKKAVDLMPEKTIVLAEKKK